ncbi:hypothetical protein, partial [Riemerella anatipestifer]
NLPLIFPVPICECKSKKFFLIDQKFLKKFLNIFLNIAKYPSQHPSLFLRLITTKYLISSNQSTPTLSYRGRKNINSLKLNPNVS